MPRDTKHEDEGAKEESGAAAEESQFKEEALTCVDCSAEFVFTVGEQEFFATKGFTNKPTRCGDCKKAKKDRMNNRDGARGGDSRGGGGFDRGGDRGGGGGGGICYANQRGECTRGDSCRFSHSGGGGGGGGDRGPRPGSFGDRGGRGGGDRGGDRGGGGGGICYANQRGECTRGDSCRFSHA